MDGVRENRGALSQIFRVGCEGSHGKEEAEAEGSP